ncbi:hypothetical protein AVEN_4328-1 [Araneus ventricosus]|uniref:Uncharacterized protein n=1 Tax=Araneus ventricosus TaxID=182803 RepID=A0A4Y2KYJ1_ARAVE|nr:hypothetical protein AVEN_4328-1 [Araneus ventricosus]
MKQHEGYFGTDLVISNHGQMTRATPELVSLSPSFHATPTGGRLSTTHDLSCNRPHTQRIFNGIGSRTLRPKAETLPLDHRGLLTILYCHLK